MTSLLSPVSCVAKKLNPLNLLPAKKAEQPSKYHWNPLELPLTKKVWNAPGPKWSTLQKVAYRTAMLAPTILLALFDLTIGFITRFTLGNLITWATSKNIKPQKTSILSTKTLLISTLALVALWQGIGYALEWNYTPFSLMSMPFSAVWNWWKGSPEVVIPKVEETTTGTVEGGGWKNSWWPIIGGAAIATTVLAAIGLLGVYKFLLHPNKQPTDPTTDPKKI